MCHRGWAGLSNRRMAIEVELLIPFWHMVRVIWRRGPGGFRLCYVGDSQFGGSVQT